MRLYIAGPMRGYEQFNFKAFDAARDRLLAAGHGVVSPADLDREEGFDETSADGYDFDVKAALRRDVLAIIDHCDSLYMLRGWETSSGARAEHALAVALGLSISYEVAGA